MNAKYMNNPDYNFDKVNRASVACGPLVKWAIAQVLLGALPRSSRKITVFTHEANRIHEDRTKESEMGSTPRERKWWQSLGSLWSCYKTVTRPF